MAKAEKKTASQEGAEGEERRILPLSRPATPQDFINLARQYGPACLETLAEVAACGTDAARVSAANSLLDRGYGKARQSVEHSGFDDLLAAIEEGRKRVREKR